MTRTLPPALILLLIIAVMADAKASEPASTPSDADREAPEAEAELPGWDQEVKFEESDEELRLPLFRADPELLEQRYVAVVRLAVPQAPDTQELPHMLQVPLRWMMHTGSFPVQPAVQVLLRELNDVGDDFLSKEAVDFLTRDAGRFIIERLDRLPKSRRDRLDRDVPHVRHFQILAPDAEQARERAEGLLILLNQRLFRPIQQFSQSRKAEREPQVVALQTELEKTRGELESLEQQRDAFEELPAETLTALRAERSKIGVDIVGIKARIEACDKRLAERNRMSARSVEQLENLKIAAEVELAGLTAKSEALDDLIRQGAKWQELNTQIAAHRERIRRHERQIANLQAQIARAESLIRAYAPFEVEDDTVLIRPVKWEKPEEQPK